MSTMVLLNMAVCGQCGTVTAQPLGTFEYCRCGGYIEPVGQLALRPPETRTLFGGELNGRVQLLTIADGAP